MHVSPISVTKRLLAAFCPRDNSLPFFMVAPISQSKNYSRKVGTRRNMENACSRYSSLNLTNSELFKSDNVSTAKNFLNYIIKKHFTRYVN